MPGLATGSQSLDGTYAAGRSIPAGIPAGPGGVTGAGAVGRAVTVAGIVAAAAGPPAAAMVVATVSASIADANVRGRARRVCVGSGISSSSRHSGQQRGDIGRDAGIWTMVTFRPHLRARRISPARPPPQGWPPGGAVRCDRDVGRPLARGAVQGWRDQVGAGGEEAPSRASSPPRCATTPTSWDTGSRPCRPHVVNVREAAGDRTGLIVQRRRRSCLRPAAGALIIWT